MTDLIPTFEASDDADPLVKRFAAQLVTVVGNTTASAHTRRAYERGASKPTCGELEKSESFCLSCETHSIPILLKTFHLEMVALTSC
jgi:hypothetical protein